MKEIQKEKTQTYTVYEAVDGTEFMEKCECEAYEKSARGVLRTRLHKLVVNDNYNEFTLLGGDEEHHIDAVVVRTEEDVKTILQLMFLEHPYLLKEAHSAWKNRIVNLVNQVCKEKDILLMGTNCDGDYYIVDTRNNIVNRLLNIDKDTKE